MQNKKEAIWVNFQDFLKDFAVNSQHPSKEYFTNNDSIEYVSGMNNPLFNGIIQKRDLSEEKVKEHLQKFISKKQPFCWWVDPENHFGVEKTLTEKGLISAGVYTGIAAPVKPQAWQENPNIKVKEVANQKEYNMWGEVLGITFGFDQETLTAYLHGQKDFGPGKSYRHYLAQLHDNPVGAISLYCSKQVCGFWNGGVIPEARRQGVATALGVACMNEAFKLGFSTAVAVLMAGKMAEKLCLKLGFHEVCHMIPYVHGYNPEALEPTKT